jgi:hypothetical protein
MVFRRLNGRGTALQRALKSRPVAILDRGRRSPGWARGGAKTRPGVEGGAGCGPPNSPSTARERAQCFWAQKKLKAPLQLHLGSGGAGSDVASNSKPPLEAPFQRRSYSAWGQRRRRGTRFSSPQMGCGAGPPCLRGKAREKQPSKAVGRKPSLGAPQRPSRASFLKSPRRAGFMPIGSRVTCGARPRCVVFFSALRS